MQMGTTRQSTSWGAEDLDIKPIISWIGGAFDWAGSQGIGCLPSQVGGKAAESVPKVLLTASQLRPCSGDQPASQRQWERSSEQYVQTLLS